MSTVSVIGAGFSGLSAAACLGQAGYDVTVLEKNSSPGGRARKLEARGFVFDMGPSWYWMPDVYEKFFNRFGKTTNDFYKLVRLDPSYRVFFSKTEILDVPAGAEPLCQMFEKIEAGSGVHLKKILEEGKHAYEVGVNTLVYKPGLSITELMDVQLLKGIFKLHTFQSLSSFIRKYFRDPHLIQLLEFPVLFLGASPLKTPAFYSLMNYADMVLGTWYPVGGMYSVVEAMHQIGKEQGVKFEFNSDVEALELDSNTIQFIKVNGVLKKFDYVIASADYHHVEQNLLPPPFRKYSTSYWEKRVMAPSCLIFYLGINKRLKNILHHNLFFDKDFDLHTKEIYENPAWPANPLFYVCCPSQTDPSVAAAGNENIFILIPVAAGLTDTEDIRKKYFDLVISRIESLTNQSIQEHIIFKKSYAHNDFITDYHAFKGNAFGLANTLMQTANFKPSIINKKVKNLYYAGQLTIPGPGVPPAIISGQVVAQQLIKTDLAKRVHKK